MSNKMNELKSIKVNPKDHETFSIMCIKEDLNQPELFNKMLETYKEHKDD